MMPGLDPYRRDGDFDELHDRLAAAAAAAAADQAAQPGPEPEPPPKQPKPGRDAGGRFVKGNPGGCGNPFARQVASFREALYEAVTRDMLKDLACRLWGMAMGGNVAAARLLLQYLVGKPQDPPHPDRVDRDEWQAYQSDAVPGQEFNQLMASMPVPMAVHLAQGVWPIVAEYMIRRPMADMFKADPPAEKVNGKPKKAKKDRSRSQEAPIRNGDNGVEPATAPSPAAAAGPAVPRAEDQQPSEPSVPTAPRAPAAPVSHAPAGDHRHQTASNGGAVREPADARPGQPAAGQGARVGAGEPAPSTDGAHGAAPPRAATRDGQPACASAPSGPAARPPSPTATTADHPAGPPPAHPAGQG